MAGNKLKKKIMKPKKKVEKPKKEPFKEPVNNSGLNLFDLHTIPRDIILGYLSITELIAIASISTAHLIWVRSYFARFKVLNIKPCAYKMCLSSEPCCVFDSKCSRGKYPHRVISAIKTMKELCELGLLNVNTIYIEARFKPKVAICGIQLVKGVCKLFNTGIQRVLIDVSNEDLYVEPVESLLKANTETLQEFNVHHPKPADSKLLFVHTLDRTKWTAEESPMAIAAKKRKLKHKNQKQMKKRIRDQNAAQANA